MTPVNPYPWLTINEDGSMEADHAGTTIAEGDRRLIIMQELQSGNVRLLTCAECGDTGTRRVRSHEDYGVSFESEPCDDCELGRALVAAEEAGEWPEPQHARLRLDEYERSKQVDARLCVDDDFYAIVAALMRNADSTNLPLLRAAFPNVWNDLYARYNKETNE